MGTWIIVLLMLIMFMDYQPEEVWVQPCGVKRSTQYLIIKRSIHQKCVKLIHAMNTSVWVVEVLITMEIHMALSVHITMLITPLILHILR